MAESIKCAAICNKNFFDFLKSFNLNTLVDPKNRKVW